MNFYDPYAKEMIGSALVLMDEGRSWCKGHGREDETGNATVAWAAPWETTAWCVGEALRDSSQALRIIRGDFFVEAVRDRASDLILEAAGPAFTSVPDWNDAPDRTWDDVEQALTEAAA